MEHNLLWDTIFDKIFSNLSLEGGDPILLAIECMMHTLCLELMFTHDAFVLIGDVKDWGLGLTSHSQEATNGLICES